MSEAACSGTMRRLMQPEQFVLFAEIEQRHWWFVARQRIIHAVVIELLQPGTHSKIVDIGCGTGGILGGLADRYECTGIDASKDAMREAEHHYPHIRFLHTSDPAALETRNAADLLLFLDVLEHVRDDRSLLHDIVLTMRPGALLVIAVPADMALWSPHDKAVGHFRRYDAASLSTLWSNLPVRVRLLTPFNAYLYPMIRFARMLCRVKKKSWGESQTDFSMPPKFLNKLLTWIFSREEKRIHVLLQGKGRPFHRGVSLLAVLERI